MLKFRNRNEPYDPQSLGKELTRMKAFTLKFVVFVLVLTAAQVLGQESKAVSGAPKLLLPADSFDFGKVAEGTKVSHTFKIKNEGAGELVIKNVSPACGCTASDFTRQIAPGAEGVVQLTVNTAGMSGKTERYADVITNDPKAPFQKLWLRMTVEKAVATAAAETKKPTVLDFTMKSIDGKDTPLSSYKGKVIMIVNVASKCGYTPQYEGLQAIYAKYKDQGLVILGIPANNFMGQEPGTDEEIKTFCQTKYNVSFPMFSKVSVKGSDIHPLYQYLTSKETNPEFAGDITWNFNKFLVDRDGKVIARFSTKEKPESEVITQKIEQALK
jgi:glutathione peroxidase